jgi:hypothetical protein
VVVPVADPPATANVLPAAPARLDRGPRPCTTHAPMTERRLTPHGPGRDGLPWWAVPPGPKGGTERRPTAGR